MILYEVTVKFIFQSTISLAGEPGNSKHLEPHMQIVLRKSNNYIIIP